MSGQAVNSGWGELDAGAREEELVTNILVVDDLPEKLLVFETMLEELNQNLVFVRSGAEALREVLRREFAVILLDVNMPDIDGFETARLIRRYRRSAHTPIIFITAYADEMQTARGYALGAVDYIMSPVVPEVLRSKVRVFVELQVMQRRLRRQAEERVALAASEAARRAAEEATERSNFLARAGAELGGSLELEVARRKLLSLVVPRLAPRAMLLLLDGLPDSGSVMATADVDPTDGSIRCGERLLESLDPALQHGLNEVLERRTPLLLPARAPHGAGSAAAAGAWAGGAIVPLGVGERVIGALWAGIDPSRTELALLGDLADRAAIAFENARLYRSLQAEIVDRRQAEQRLRDASRRKDEFLAMLSHELRNPLAPIRNAVELIRRLAPPDPKLAWATEVSDRQVAHLTRLVEELLDVARISQGKIALRNEPLDLLAAVAQAVETVRPYIDARGHQLALRQPDAPVWLRGDAGRLAQVVGNLLHNAAKYTPDGGSIQLELQVEHGEALLTVSDNGIGIEPELLPNVFELFEQGQRSLDRSQGGLGVGLTLVQRLVQLHHGTVEVTSAGRGHGAQFRVRLPCLSEVRPEEPASGAEGASLAGGAGGCRVLVVDDNRDAAETTAMFLQLAGHEVKTVGDGQQALASAPVYAPDVVVLDIGLPGLDGYEVARRLRRLAQTERALLIALTGYGQASDQRQAEEAGFDAHYVKPTDPGVLAARIQAWREAVAAPHGVEPATAPGRAEAAPG
jgi:signal transduction histidine kinase/DNA-binding response OmpR family regulator